MARHERELREAYREAIEGELREGEAAVSSRKVEAALVALDALGVPGWEQSNEGVGRVAYVAGAQYGLQVVLVFRAEEEEVEARGRVVRNDGKLVKKKEMRVGWAKGERGLDVGRGVILRLLRELELKGLSRGSEVAVVSSSTPEVVMPSVHPVHDAHEAPVLAPVPATAPPLQAEATAGEGFHWKAAGYVGVGLGVGGVIAGLVTLAAEPTYRRDEAGNIYGPDLPAFRTARMMAGIGAGLLVAGALVAVAGGAVVLWAPAKGVKVSFVATSEGTLVTMGGGF